MAKRFRDTRSFKDAFVRKLPSDYKLLWFFILDECDHAGIWKVDVEAGNFYTGANCAALQAQALFAEKIEVLDDETWFVKGFIKFQYGKLSDVNKVHRSVSALLQAKGLASPIIGPKDKEEVKAMDTDKDSSITTDAKSFRDYFWKAFEKRFGKKPTYDKTSWIPEKERSLVKQHGLSDLCRRIDNYMRDGYVTNQTYRKFLADVDAWNQYREKRVKGDPDEYESKRGKTPPVPLALPKGMLPEF